MLVKILQKSCGVKVQEKEAVQSFIVFQFLSDKIFDSCYFIWKCYYQVMLDWDSCPESKCSYSPIMVFVIFSINYKRKKRGNEHSNPTKTDFRIIGSVLGRKRLAVFYLPRTNSLLYLLSRLIQTSHSPFWLCK
jgi:hypothetical protein